MSNPIIFAAPRMYTAKEKLKILREIDACKSPRTIRQILGTHNISTEELAAWRNALEDHGQHGLFATKNMRRRAA